MLTSPWGSRAGMPRTHSVCLLYPCIAVAIVAPPKPSALCQFETRAVAAKCVNRTQVLLDHLIGAGLNPCAGTQRLSRLEKAPLITSRTPLVILLGVPFLRPNNRSPGL